MAQLAEEGDEISNSTKIWPESREFVEMGEIIINRLRTMDEGAEPGQDQKRIIYDTAPRYIQVIGVSDDLLIEMRTAVYLIIDRIWGLADRIA